MKVKTVYWSPATNTRNDRSELIVHIEGDIDQQLYELHALLVHLSVEEIIVDGYGLGMWAARMLKHSVNESKIKVTTSYEKDWKGSS